MCDAAPGVAKTYEMPTTARTKKAEGIVRVVETHSRKENEALFQGLEIFSRRIIAHKGHTLAEMDIVTLSARRPSLVPIDELAHSNAPESGHPKRCTDVEEQRATGITFYTTLNIQRVESFNDIAAGLTKIRVRETVPDSTVDRADEIELVDLTPKDLIARVNEGMVFVPAQAESAIKHFFARKSYGITGARAAPDGIQTSETLY